MWILFVMLLFLSVFFNFSEKLQVVSSFSETKMFQFSLSVFHLTSKWNQFSVTGAFPRAQLVRNPPATQETLIWFLGQDDLLEKGQATHSSSLGLPLWLSWQRICLQCRRPGFDLWVGKIPWRRETLHTPGFWPGEFDGPWGHRVGHDWATFTLLFIGL